MSEGVRKRSMFATHQPASTSYSSLGKKRWIDAVETVLSQSSIEIPSDSLVGKACSYVSLPTDSISEKNLKGFLFLVGIGCAISSLFLAIESYLITSSKWSLVFPMMAAVATGYLLLEFQTTKQLQPFFKGTLILLFSLPLVIQLTVGHSFISCTFSLVSFFAPFCAILYDVNEAESWLQIGLGAHGVLVLLELITGDLTIYSFIDLFNLLTLLTVVFYSIHYHVSGLNKTKTKLNLANTFLRTQKKELIGENEELTKEVEKLKNINNNEHFSVDHESQAEKIITIMSNLKKSEAFKDFIDDIEFVVRTVSAGKNIYLPDMKASLEGNVHLDSSMKSFILSHNHHGIHYDPIHEKHMHFSELTNSDEKHGNTVLHSEEVESLLQGISGWNFDIFALDIATQGEPLYYTGLGLFRYHNLVKKFKIDPFKLKNFLLCVESGYKKSNPYHNNIHAADVAQTVNFFLGTPGVKKLLKDTDIFAAIVAALIHDIDHPGFNNAFEVNTLSERALLHNDLSVLENHHLATGFQILMDPQNNIFEGVPPEELRSTIIEMVLATDFSKHLEVLGQFKSRKASGEFKDCKEDRVLVLKMALKCADISHTAKKSELHFNWTKRVTEEFFKQGDEEKQKGLPISPFMDRETANLPKSQSGFISFLVLPLYQAFVQEFPEAKVALDQVEENLNHWKQQCTN